jgi:oligosaccharide repeat unit polymerase
MDNNSSNKQLLGVTKHFGKMHGLRLFLKALYSPPFLVFSLTMAPFVIPLSDFLNDRTRGLSRTAGIDFGLYGYALTCVLAFWFAYKLFVGRGSPVSMGLQHYKISKRVTQKCRRTAVLAVSVLLAVGLVVLFYTISDSYVEDLIQSALIQEANPALRDSSGGFIASENVPGIIRMFAHTTVGCLIFMYAIALVAPPWLRGWHGYWVLLLVSGLAILARSMIVLDRTPVIMTLAVGVFVVICRMRFTKIQMVATALGISLMLLIGVAFLNISYSIRVGTDDRYNQILEYADLGIANASLAYRTTSQVGWGTSTLMGPIRMIPRGLGINFEFPLPDSVWTWNPASNLLCLSIREFWMFGFIIYLIYGAVMGRVMRGRRNHPESIFWGLAHLWGISILLSIWTQPTVDSPDLWIAILTTLAIARYIDGFSYPIVRSVPVSPGK